MKVTRQLMPTQQPIEKLIMSILTLEEIEYYQELQNDLKSIKELEMKVRVKIAEKIKKQQKKSEPNRKTFNLIVEEEYQLKLKETTNINVDQEFLANNYNDMFEDEQECFKLKYEISQLKFKKFLENFEEKLKQKNHGFVIFDAITSKPGAPTIEIKKLD